MAVKIRLARGGKKKQPFYQIVVANSTSPRDGKFLENVGYYNPMTQKLEEKTRFSSENIQNWIKKGAKPTETVAKIITRFSGSKELKESVSIFLPIEKNKAPKKESKQ